MAVAQDPDGMTESTIYFTAETVSFDEAVHILRHHGVEVQDARPGTNGAECPTHTSK